MVSASSALVRFALGSLTPRSHSFNGSPIMSPTEFLASLTDAEREFIAGLDYGNDQERHREELDRLIEHGGVLTVRDRDQLWYPYEVVELGKNWRQAGHDREFVACGIIVLLNIIHERDEMNSLDAGLEVVVKALGQLPLHLRDLLEALINKVEEMG